MASTIVKVIHIYEHEPHEFAEDLADALRRVSESGGIIDDVKYAIDPSTEINRRGGFGALILYEVPAETT